MLLIRLPLHACVAINYEHAKALYPIVANKEGSAGQAMNRSLANVILGGYGASKGPAMAVEGTHTETDSNHVVEMLTGARDVIIVPGAPPRFSLTSLLASQSSVPESYAQLLIDIRGWAFRLQGLA